MTLKRFSPGEPFTAFPGVTWNTLVDQAERTGTIPENEKTVPPQPGRIAEGSIVHALPVMVLNKSDAHAREFGILGIDKPAFTPPDATDDDKATDAIFQGVYLECVAATEADHGSSFIITLQSIAKDEIGWAVLMGTTWARVDIQSVADTHAVIDPGDPTRLKGAGGGHAKIVWKPEGTGLKWCVVQIGGGVSDSQIGVTTTAIAAADWTAPTLSLGKGTVQLYRVKPPPDPNNPPDPPEIEKLTDDQGADVTEDWYNIVPAPVSSGRVVKRANWSGYKIVDLESCVSVSP